MQRFLITVRYQTRCFSPPESTVVNNRMDLEILQAVHREDVDYGLFLTDGWRELHIPAYGKPRAFRAVEALTTLLTRTPRRRDDPVRNVLDWKIEICPNRDPTGDD